MAREGGETKCLKILTAFKDFQGRVRRMYNFLTWVAGLRDHSKKKNKNEGLGEDWRIPPFLSWASSYTLSTGL